MFKTRRGLLLFTVLVISGIYCINKYVIPHGPDYLEQMDVPEENFYIFKDLKGPMEKSVVKEKQRTSWRKYHTINPSALCILLTDTSSDWMGLTHGLADIGVPFVVTDDVKEAIAHPVLLAYPVISGVALDKAGLQMLAAVPRNGGTLIATNVLGGGLNEVFGFDSVRQSSSRSQLKLNPNSLPLMKRVITDSAEQSVRLYDPKTFPDAISTNGYTRARVPLILFDDSTCCLAYKDYGRGRSYAFGLDIGSYFLRYMNERGFNASRTYVNHYEPGMDVLLRIIREIYVSAQADAVTVGTVPYNKSLTLLITHDIDFTKSIVNAAKYAELEKSQGVKGTYFIQTKYIRDWNDDIFFNDTNIRYLLRVNDLGMEVASHSVSHSRVFSKFPIGSGEEEYPDYSPFVKERTVTFNGSVLGELRVSKFLLEHFTPGLKVVSFRPGHLQYPFCLPQALESVGYSYSSSVTANDVQTHLPFMQMYDRGFDAELNTVEIPVTVEDEAGLPLLQRLDSTLILAQKLSGYGGVLNILIHTDILGQKYEYEQKVIGALKDKAWAGTIGEFGSWWRVRNQVIVSVKSSGGKHEVVVTNKSGQPINGLCLKLPVSWKLMPGDNNIIQDGNIVIINHLQERVSILFQ